MRKTRVHLLRVCLSSTSRSRYNYREVAVPAEPFAHAPFFRALIAKQSRRRSISAHKRTKILANLPVARMIVRFAMWPGSNKFTAIVILFFLACCAAPLPPEQADCSANDGKRIVVPSECAYRPHSSRSSVAPSSIAIVKMQLI